MMQTLLWLLAHTDTGRAALDAIASPDPWVERPPPSWCPSDCPTPWKAYNGAWLRTVEGLVSLAGSSTRFCDACGTPRPAG